jgi:hypothetical protein
MGEETGEDNINLQELMEEGDNIATVRKIGKCTKDYRRRRESKRGEREGKREERREKSEESLCRFLVLVPRLVLVLALPHPFHRCLCRGNERRGRGYHQTKSCYETKAIP